RRSRGRRSGRAPLSDRALPASARAARRRTRSRRRRARGGSARRAGRRGGGLVGSVGVVVMDPEEEGARLRGREPAEGGIGRRVGGALDIGRAAAVVATGQVV